MRIQDVPSEMHVTSAGCSATPGLVLKNGDLYGVFDAHGDIDSGLAPDRGLYLGCTRFLSSYKIRILEMGPPVVLSSSVGTDNTTLFTDLTNPPCPDYHGKPLKTGSLFIHRESLLFDTNLLEKFTVLNQTSEPIALTVGLQWESDFKDLFEIRGCDRPARGKRLPGEDPKLSAYTGLDGITRQCRVAIQQPGANCSPGFATMEFTLPPHKAKVLTIHAACWRGGAGDTPPESFSADLKTAHQALRIQRQKFEAKAATIRTSNQAFQAWIDQSYDDLALLTTETEHGLYPYAGVPWFCAPFGRDALVVGFQTLWHSPQLTRGILSYLAAHQGKEHSAENECQPGKIMHERREGEMVALGELPYGCYYGTADATPLFLWLLGEYVKATGDTGFRDEMAGAAASALEWIEQYSDTDGDGFADYIVRNDAGLRHQGWKDADDAVTHKDGTLATPPIALCELQAYTYRAWLSAAEMIESAGGRNVEVEQLRAKAADLKKRFNSVFWDSELSSYILALSDGGKPARVVSSNAAHCLFAGIATGDNAAEMAKQFSTPSVLTGWGIRTLASGAVAYNPLSYHNGSVWPHDSAIAMAGFSRYGNRDLAEKIFEGLFGVAQLFDNRLPELFAGFLRRPFAPPIRYPNACSPQAWACGVPFHLIKSCLGIEIDGFKKQVKLNNPWLPSFQDRIEINGLRVGSSTLDLLVTRRGKTADISSRNENGSVSIVIERNRAQ